MKKHHAIGLGSLVVLVIVIVGLAIIFNNKAAAPAATNTTNQGTTSMQLQKTDETVGTGAEAVAGDTVTVNYTGTLENGTVFDSSYSRNQPFSFKLGAGQVIKGWDEGVVGMKVGGKRKLVIPPSLGYGDQATGSIPANSTLIFQIQLLSVQ
ncbi:MAG TPA: FKBP-type peptidyl-prolyl cis-trans isomerase [Candidatus Saccharimonadales bacterium]|nr:FKBP-type peptidyl-prolyl cis-trans isomerase [Candidatus Saccharimonadales bacterium]